MKEKNKKILRKNLLFILPLILLILYFLYPLLITTYESLSDAKAERCFENCRGLVFVCEEKCNFIPHTYKYSYSEKLIKNYSSSYQKIFRSQNIIIILLGLILYYGVIFGFSILKKLEKRT